MTFEHMTRTDQDALGWQLRRASQVRANRMDQILDGIHLAATELDELARDYAPATEADDDDNRARRAVEAPPVRAGQGAGPSPGRVPPVVSAQANGRAPAASANPPAPAI